MRKVRDWPVAPSEDVARIALKLLLDDEPPDEPQHLIDQARAWLRHNFGRPKPVRSWTCIGFFGVPAHDQCKREDCDCPCHSATSATGLQGDDA